MKVVTKIELQECVYVWKAEATAYIGVCLYWSMHLCVPHTGLYTHINTHSGAVNLKSGLNTRVQHTHSNTHKYTHWSCG